MGTFNDPCYNTISHLIVMIYTNISKYISLRWFFLVGKHGGKTQKFMGNMFDNHVTKLFGNMLDGVIFFGNMG